MNENIVFKNSIDDKQLKEHLGDSALAVLANLKLIEMPKDLKHLIVEFGYLLVKPDGEICTMLKVMPPKRLFKPQKTYYFGSQDGKLMFLNESFTEETFRKIQSDMFNMHKINYALEDKSKYKMELY
jgi:hypothetical protein